SAVFVASNVRTPARLSSFRPHIGCVPASGGGRRTPAVAHVVPPGHPSQHRVWTVKVIPGMNWSLTKSCAAGETLVDATNAVGFYTAKPPAASLMRAVSVSQVVRNGKTTVSIRSTAAVLGARGIVQIGLASCGGQ